MLQCSMVQVLSYSRQNNIMHATMTELLKFVYNMASRPTNKGRK